MLQTDFKIAALIAKYLAGEMEPQEQDDLNKWKNESEHNKLLFDRLTHPLGLQQYQKMASYHDVYAGWHSYLQKRRVLRRRVFLYRTSYAAIFLLLLSVGYFFASQRIRSSKMPAFKPVVSELIVPGGTKANLILADGSAIALEELDSYKLEERIEREKVESGDAPTPPTVFHTIETPRGGEYVFTLSDGTVVQLNAMSTIRFPIVFGNNPRLVELDGEAFFEVASALQPFIIKTKDMLVEVLGTSFNISSYADETNCSVTLVKGSLQIQAGNNDGTIVLTPSQHAQFNRNTGEISVQWVDVSSYISWSNGMFCFKDWTLESIMHYLARWYNIDEVIYRDEDLKTIMFGCKLSKHDNIEVFLNAFEHTGKVHYTIQNKTIIFSH